MTPEGTAMTETRAFVGIVGEVGRGKRVSENEIAVPDSLPLPLLISQAGDNWPEIQNDPVKLRAFSQVVHANLRLEAGLRPLGWRRPAFCRRCGPIWLFGRPDPALTSVVLGCPWCHVTPRDGFIQRPASVRCGSCRHFTPDPISLGAGVGECLTGYSHRLGLACRPGTRSSCAGFVVRRAAQ